MGLIEYSPKCSRSDDEQRNSSKPCLIHQCEYMIAYPDGYEIDGRQAERSQKDFFCDQIVPKERTDQNTLYCD